MAIILTDAERSNIANMTMDANNPDMKGKRASTVIRFADRYGIFATHTRFDALAWWIDDYASGKAETFIQSDSKAHALYSLDAR